jgi:hypothetical protein
MWRGCRRRPSFRKFALEPDQIATSFPCLGMVNGRRLGLCVCRRRPESLIPPNLQPLAFDPPICQLSTLLVYKSGLHMHGGSLLGSFRLSKQSESRGPGNKK